MTGCAETSERRAGRRSEAEAEDTRRQVAEAALRVFAERGFAAASLRDIASEAGTSHALLRHHFGSKDGVWRAAVDHATERLATALAPFAAVAADGTLDPVVQAKGAIRAALTALGHQPDTVRLLLHEGVRGGPQLTYALERFAPFGEMMAPLFDRLQAAGHLQQFDNRTLFLFVLTAGAAPLALPALSGWVLGKPVLDGQDVEAHVERVLTTLLGAPEEPAAGRA